MSGTEPGRLLLYSDNQANASLLQQFLQGEGWTVVSTGTLAEALAATDGPLRTALLDAAVYPPPFWRLCDALRRGRVPFHVLVMGPAPDLQVRLYRAGARTVLHKPVGKHQLRMLLIQATPAPGNGGEQPDALWHQL